jgi:hypothetical protein
VSESVAAMTERGRIALGRMRLDERERRVLERAKIKNEKRLRLNAEDRFLLLRGIDRLLRDLDRKRKSPEWDFGEDEKLRSLAQALHEQQHGRRRKWSWSLPESKEIHKWVERGPGE